MAPEDLSEAGRTSHGSGSEPVTPEDEWPADIRRSFVAGSTLRTVSERGVMASDLDALTARAFLPFASS